MADVKWIKIVTDIFDDEKMYAIETLQDGYLIEVAWFKILCLAAKCNQGGFLIVNRKIAYTDEMLSKIFRMEIGTVKRAIEIFEQLEMIEVVDNAYMVMNWSKYQNQDRLEEIQAKNRERQQRFRESKKQAKIECKEVCNVTDNVTSDVKNNVNCSYSYSNTLNSSSNSLIIKRIIEYLNNVCGTNYKSNTKNTVKHINVRLEDGYSEEDFYTVIEKKYKEWRGTEFEKFLRPDTLFGTKFENYLNQRQTEKTEKASQNSRMDMWRDIIDELKGEEE